MLQQQEQPNTTEQTDETSLETETFLSTSTGRQAQDDSPLVIGMLTSQDVMMYTAQEAIQDLVQGGLITLQPQLISPPRQPEVRTILSIRWLYTRKWSVEKLMELTTFVVSNAMDRWFWIGNWRTYEWRYGRKCIRKHESLNKSTETNGMKMGRICYPDFTDS